MNLPFTEAQFLDVFGAFNGALWPAVALLWVVTAIVAARWIAGRRVDVRILWTLLAVHWAWSGAVYHWVFFRSINPAATLFGAAFVVQAAIFLWLAVTSRGQLARTMSAGSVAGAALIAYGLIYPLLGFAFGLQYPRLPLFAVPCPTTIVTAGFLVAAAGVPRVGLVIPILWAAVGSTAALTLGIRADLVLVAAGLALLARLFAGPAIESRG